MELFEQPTAPRSSAPSRFIPLAERMRPRSLEDFAGQVHLVGSGKPLRLLIEEGEIPSVILWGPPGCGKTTLARIIARRLQADFFTLSAVSAGVADVRKIIDRGELNRKKLGRRTILFIDEIHRFNKAQQDALLHSVEDGILTLIGATTENPSFEVISPLLSRAMVYVLRPLDEGDLNAILDRALAADPVVSPLGLKLDPDVRSALIGFSGGDARLLLNGLEVSIQIAGAKKDVRPVITTGIVEEAFQRRHIRYDEAGEEHYNIISAFIKSMRGCDPDAAVYWLARMLEGGEDPKFIARRMIVLASEDVGNADPYALTLAVSCFTAVDSIGMPEARIPLAQTATYLASCPKSNASYKAIESATGDVRAGQNDPVPLHLRNAPTKLMKELDYGKEYLYGHDFEGHFTPQQYLPDSMKDRRYYNPADIGGESEIRKRLIAWWKGKK